MLAWVQQNYLTPSFFRFGEQDIHGVASRTERFSPAA
jgi:hypothetical protein